jgi:trimeric autotransporter adhesin
MKKLLLSIVVATLVASIGCGGSNSTGSVNKATLQSIQVTPAVTSVVVGANQTFKATGMYSDGSTQDMTASAQWSSSSTSVATISGGGVATCNSAGITTITANAQGMSGTSTLTVTATPPSLTSIAVTPASPSVVAGQTLQFTATGSYSDGSTQNLSSSSNWNSSNTNVATIASGGLAASTNPGTTTITAKDSSTGIVGTTVLTVTGALVSINVTPLNPSIAPGTTQQLIATGNYSDNSSKNMTSSVTWSSVTTNVATISNSPGTQGLATAVAPGTSTMQATLGGIVGSTTLTVTKATLQSIAVTPANPEVPLGTLQQFTATGSFSDGTMQVITGSVSWSSSSTSVMSLTQSGLGTAKNVGSATVTATSGSISGSTLAAVSAANLVSITITSAYSTIAENTSVQLTATGLFTDGSTRNLTNQVVWSSSQPSVATVSLGTAVGLEPGSTSIGATLGAISNSVNLVVTNATVSSIVVTPTGQTIAPTSVLHFTAVGFFSDATSQNISKNVTWASNNTAAATIGSLSGNTVSVSGVAAGTANISATLEGVTGTAVLTVSSATLESINLTPATSVLAPASTVQYVAVGDYSDGTTQTLTSAVTWNSSAPNVVSINSAGLATGQSTGPATITASQGSVSGTASVLVESSAPSSITVTTTNPQVPVGIVSQFVATGNFPDGSQDMTSSVAWTASPSAVASISNASGSEGFATGMTPGNASISALFAGVVGTSTLVVTDAKLDSITISPGNASIAAGEGEQFTASGSFSDGTVLTLTQQVNWSSSDNEVAPVSGGLAIGAAQGSTTITASLNGVTATAVLTVQ